MTATVSGIFWGDEEMFWNLTVVMVVQPCEYTKKHWTVRFKGVNFVVCGVSLKKLGPILTIFVTWACELLKLFEPQMSLVCQMEEGSH